MQRQLEWQEPQLFECCWHLEAPKLEKTESSHWKNRNVNERVVGFGSLQSDRFDRMIFSLSSHCHGSCSTLHQGATLLLSAPMLFSKTARFEGKLSVNGSRSLKGPCFWFFEDAFIQSSSEMHFADCHNVAKSKAGSKGGAIHVWSNLTVTGNLSIHNCSARLGGSLGLKYL